MKIKAMHERNEQKLEASKSVMCTVGDETCTPEAENIDAKLHEDDRVDDQSGAAAASGAFSRDRGPSLTAMNEQFGSRPVTKQHPDDTNLFRLKNYSPSTYFSFAVLLLFLCWGGWYYHRFKRKQQEWKDLSNLELAKIRERVLAPVNCVESSEDANPKESKGIISIESESAAAISRTNIRSQNKCTDSGSSIGGGGLIDNGSCPEDQINQTTTETLPTKSSSNDLPASKVNAQPSPKTTLETSASSESLSGVRARQQRMHEMNIQSAKQQRREQQKQRQQNLLDSLQHDVANEAYHRRKNTIIQEQELLAKQLNEQSQQAIREELQEMERNALRQQQNVAYQESLELDQERARINAERIENFKMRRKALIDAKYRLVRSGIQLPGLLDDFVSKLSNECSVGSDPVDNIQRLNRNDIQVRLLLPSGQRFQGTFTESNSIGLIYDFALVSLEKENLLWNQEDDDVAAEAELLESHDSSHADHDSVQIIWKRLFHSFSIVSTYPQKSHNDLSITLNQSGLSQSVTLMVVIETD